MDCCLVSRVEYRWRRGSSVGVKENIGKGTIELVLMSMLLEEDMYGYQLVQSISKLSNGVLSINTGAMYTSLYKLEEEGYITSISTKVKNRQIRIYYHLTDSGRDYREVLLTEYLELQKAMNCLLKIEKKE